MPSKIKVSCKYPNCPALIEAEQRYCEQHLKQSRQTQNRDRGSSAQQGYGARWRKARTLWLSANPLCVVCDKAGRLTAATVVDHVVPHRGDYEAFWNQGNWQSLCATCHNSKTMRESVRPLRG